MANNEKQQLLENLKNKLDTFTPAEMVKYLDRYVVGQERAKRTISIAVYNHYKRLLVNEGMIKMSKKFDQVVIDKSNVLLLGNTGTGKTFMLQTLARELDVPLYIGDANSLTAAGYVGDDVEMLLSGLYNAAGQNIDVAQMGIIIIDEIDKIASKNINGSSTSLDVGGECVQQGLLKILESSKVECMPDGGRMNSNREHVIIDTTNILYFGLGAFCGIHDIVRKRLKIGGINKPIGFSDKTKSNDVDLSDDEVLDKVTPADLKKFGFIPEFIGRFPVITHTNALTTDDLCKIITSTDNSVLRQYQKLLSVDGIKLTMDDSAVFVIANLAEKNRTGARGIGSIMSKVLQDTMFYAASNKQKNYTITAENVFDATLYRKHIL